MDKLAWCIGNVVIVAVIGVLVIGLFSLIGFLACSAWIAFSDTFRAICKAESLIREYRKNRDKFMEWQKEKENG